MTGQQLKNSILQMAVQGKLVPQDPNDEPASVLLERIRKEKEQLIKEGKIKKEKNPSYIFRGADNLPYEKVGKNEPVCIADEVPFEIPDSWEWTRVSSLGSIVRGSGIKRTETVEIGKPCVRYGELYTTYHTSFTQAVSFVPEELFDRCKHFSFGDILLTLTGENKPDIAKAVAYLGNDEIAAGGDLAYWTAHGMNPLYLTYLMASPYVVGRKVSLATGDIIVHISGDKLGTILIPIPPLSEQQRIIEKILEAEVKLTEYTDKENSLNVLQNTFPDALKKSILQWAVQGKLVPQDENDEPASVLLERIRAEKQKLIAEGKIKKDKHESVIFRRDNSHYEKCDSEEVCIDEELPFELPDTWSWARLGELCSVVTGRLDANAQTPNGEYAFFTCGREVFKTNTYAFDCDAILLGGNNASGDYKMHRYSGKFNAYQRVYVISGREPDFLSYLYYVITFWLGYLKKNSQGTTTRFIKLGQVTRMLVPVPPCAEQKRITQTIQLLLSECSRLQ